MVSTPVWLWILPRAFTAQPGQRCVLPILQLPCRQPISTGRLVLRCERVCLILALEQIIRRLERLGCLLEDFLFLRRLQRMAVSLKARVMPLQDRIFAEHPQDLPIQSRLSFLPIDFGKALAVPGVIRYIIVAALRGQVNLAPPDADRSNILCTHPSVISCSKNLSPSAVGCS